MLNRLAFVLKILIAFTFMMNAARETHALASTREASSVANQAGQAESKEKRSSLPCKQNAREIVAAPLHHPLTQIFPTNEDWDAAAPIFFCSNWKGDLDPLSQTEVRILWSDQFLYFRFVARYRELTIFPDVTGRREKLWQRDVAEVFLQADTKMTDRYKEVEVSPKGDWLDLNVFPGGTSNLACDLRTKASVSEKNHLWTTELALPAKCITQTLNPDSVWKINLFRIEGVDPNRRYFAWQPTNTHLPNFHVPKVFGTLRFSHH